MTTAAEWVAFLNARLDEDEEAARDARACAEVKDGRWFDGEDEINDDNGYRLATVNHPFVTAHIALHDPDRELREVEVKRRLIERYERAAAVPESVSSFVRGQDSGYREACLDAIKDLTAAYSDFPGYRQEWAP